MSKAYLVIANRLSRPEGTSRLLGIHSRDFVLEVDPFRVVSNHRWAQHFATYDEAAWAMLIADLAAEDWFVMEPYAPVVLGELEADHRGAVGALEYELKFRG